MVSRHLLTFASCLMLIVQPALLLPAAEPGPTALDVILNQQNGIEGKLVDAQGNPTAGAKLTALRSGQVSIVTTTDDTGSFKLTEMKPGVYTVICGDRSVVLRAWRKDTAPPSSKEAVLLVNGDIRRGQLGDLNPFYGSLSAEVLAVGVLTAAVAIPLSISLSHPSGS